MEHGFDDDDDDHPWNNFSWTFFFLLFDGNMPKTSSLVVAPERTFQLCCGLVMVSVDFLTVFV